MAHALSLLALSLAGLILLAGADDVSVEQWGRGGALLYTLRTRGAQVTITDWGATVTSFNLLDSRTGKDVDIVLGFDTLEPYMNGSSPFFGTIVGRVANRIKNARFTLNGTTYFLEGNDHNNTLHGGFLGYNDMFWRSRVVTKKSGSPSVEFLLYSYNTEQGFPGDVDITVTYTLSSTSAGSVELRVEMQALTRNRETPLNLAHHSYWNLAGHNSGTILNHTVQISASEYTPVDNLLIPTGQIVSVEGTPFDFRRLTSVGSRIQQVPGGGYDHNFVLGGRDVDVEGLHHAVSVQDPVSSRRMEIWTNKPGIQFYSGNMIPEIHGKENSVYKAHGAMCLETQGFPNAVNQPNFPSVILKPGETYTHIMVHKFTH